MISQDYLLYDILGSIQRQGIVTMGENSPCDCQTALWYRPSPHGYQPDRKEKTAQSPPNFQTNTWKIDIQYNPPIPKHLTCSKQTPLARPLASRSLAPRSLIQKPKPSLSLPLPPSFPLDNHLQFSLIRTTTLTTRVSNNCQAEAYKPYGSPPLLAYLVTCLG